MTWPYCNNILQFRLRSSFDLQLLMECAADSEIREKISEMDAKSLKTRVGKLYDLRKQWRNGDLENMADNSQEQMTILKVSISYLSLTQNANHCKGHITLNMMGHA